MTIDDIEREREHLRKMLDEAIAKKEEKETYGKFKQGQEKARAAMAEAHIRNREAQNKARETHPDWGGFS